MSSKNFWIKLFAANLFFYTFMREMIDEREMQGITFEFEHKKKVQVILNLPHATYS